ncbi:MAG: OsmC family protein [Bacteroidetes bacterium]|nr:OsmC family protein [Bacteroidota bacterium]MBS1541502.1 OsmC family protein [Bacteroidota bacterium]
MQHHHYKTKIKWTGNKGEGTTSYRAYGREYNITIDHKPEISGSADPAFCGDQTKHNPEDLFVSSLAACHMLWYLHLCAEAGVVVIDYQDHATGTMTEAADGSGHFEEVTLNPVVTVADESMLTRAAELHGQANKFCFVANSVNFPVRHNPTIIIQPS